MIIHIQRQTTLVFWSGGEKRGGRRDDGEGGGGGVLGGGGVIWCGGIKRHTITIAALLCASAGGDAIGVTESND